MTITVPIAAEDQHMGPSDLARLAEKIFDDIAALSPDAFGISRPAYSEIETQALEYLERVARKFGLRTWYDAVANLVIAAPDDLSEETPCGFFGSHVDSVPQGGNFDGLAGVVAALLTLISMVKDGVRTKVPLRVLALRGEESAWFGNAYMGSQALFGKLDAAALATRRRDDTTTLFDAMRDTGISMANVEAGRPFVDASKVHFFLELHIEQGPVLVERQWPVAAVTGIRGNFRHQKIQCIGEAGHSGAVPRWLRRDAVFAASELIMRMDDHWSTIQQHGGDLVLTAGIFQTDASRHAMSRIPGEVTFSFEARSQDTGTLRALEELLKSECRLIERERQVKFVFDEVVHAAPAETDPTMVKAILAACSAEDLPAEAIASGAGHDAAIFAQAGIPTGMIFVRNRNGSHNPNEQMDVDDLIAAVGVMRRVAMELTQ